MTPDRKSALVIGAGLGGLTTALALSQAGWRVRICERAGALGEVGAGITLSPGACRGLASLGLESDLLGASLPVPNIAFLHYRSGELLAGTPPDRSRPGSGLDPGLDTPRHIHRADLHEILVRALGRNDPAAIDTGKRLTGVHRDGSSNFARFADGSTAQAELLIGADGTRSSVRQSLFDASAPQFAGQIAFRCLIPARDAAPFMGAGNAAVFIGAARIFNRYLLRRATLLNVIGIARSDRWREEGWNTPASIEEFLREFAGFHPDVTALIERAPPQSLIKWGLFTRPPLRNWSLGNVVLVGDAAHPILPFLGLGAALAIEDGVVLARALRLAADLPSGLTAFQRARQPRVDEIRAQSIRQGEIIQSADPDGFGVRRSPSQNAGLFDYNPCTVPITV